MSAFILSSLEEKYRKLGTSSDVYKKECEFYTEVMENACKSEYNLDGRFLTHLSPDTVTADVARPQPDTSNDIAEAVG